MREPSAAFVSIIPGDGWYYAMLEDDEQLHIWPIAYWGLVEESIDGERVRGVRAYSPGAEPAQWPDDQVDGDDPHFVCFLHRSEVRRVAEIYAGAIESTKERLQRRQA